MAHGCISNPCWICFPDLNPYKGKEYFIMAKKELKKPEIKQGEPYWDYHEVIHYIEGKYKIKTRGYTPKVVLPSYKKDLDFWLWIIDHNQIHNGSYFYMNMLGDIDHDEDEWKEGDAEDDGHWDLDSFYRPRWVREIQKLIYDEFKPENGEMKFFVCW